MQRVESKDRDVGRQAGNWHPSMQGCGLRDPGLAFRVSEPGFTVQESGLRVEG